MAKKKFTPQEQERIKKRIEFVQANPELAPAEARKRFFVQTRAAELTAAGKEVNRKALRQQFTSGNVKRKGFYTEADLQRIASSKTGTNKTTDGTDTGTKKTGNVAGPNVRVGVGKMAPQSLAEYKVDRTKNANTLGEEMRYMREKGIYKTAFGQIGPDGKMTPLGAGLAKIGEVTVNAVESAKASFINPLLNSIEGVKAGYADFKKNPSLKTFWSGGESLAEVKQNPKYRKTSIGEDIMNSLIALPPGTGRVAAEGLSARLSKAGFASQSARIDALLKVTGGAERAGSVFAKELEPPAPISGRGLNAPGKSVGPKGPGKNMSSYKNLAEGRGLTYRTATPTEPVEFPGLTPTPTKAPKPKKGTTKTTPKAATKKVSQTKLQQAVDAKIETGVKNATKPEPVASKPVAKKAPTKKTSTKKAPTKTQEFSEMISSDVRQTTTKIGGKTKIGDSEFVVGKTESGLPSYTRVKPEAPAPVSKPVAKKAAASKPSRRKMQRSFQERTQAVVSGSTGNLPSSFKSQQEYNTWLAKGGKYKLQTATQEERDVFFKVNRSFVQIKGAEVRASREAAANELVRKRRVAGKYKNASPAVQARYNKLVTHFDTNAAIRRARLKGIAK